MNHAQKLALTEQWNKTRKPLREILLANTIEDAKAAIQNSDIENRYKILRVLVQEVSVEVWVPRALKFVTVATYVELFLTEFPDVIDRQSKVDRHLQKIDRFVKNCGLTLRQKVLQFFNAEYNKTLNLTPDELRKKLVIGLLVSSVLLPSGVWVYGQIRRATFPEPSTNLPTKVSPVLLPFSQDHVEASGGSANIAGRVDISKPITFDGKISSAKATLTVLCPDKTTFVIKDITLPYTWNPAAPLQTGHYSFLLDYVNSEGRPRQLPTSVNGERVRNITATKNIEFLSFGDKAINVGYKSSAIFPLTIFGPGSIEVTIAGLTKPVSAKVGKVEPTKIEQLASQSELAMLKSKGGILMIAEEKGQWIVGIWDVKKFTPIARIWGISIKTQLRKIRIGGELNSLDRISEGKIPAYAPGMTQTGLISD